MHPSKKLLTLIFFITLVCLIIDLPKNLPLRLSWGPWHINTRISSPDIHISLGPVSFHRELKTRLGLDLQGGTQLTLEAKMGDIAQEDRLTALEAAKNIIDRRINFFGVTEPIVQTSRVGESYRVIIELPGIKDVNEAIDLIGKTAQLEFRTREASVSAEIATSSAHLFGFTKQSGLTGKDLRRSMVQFDGNTGQPEVGLEFNEEGGKRFADLTGSNIGKQIAIMLDGQILSAPVVNEAISGGNAVIRGSFSTDEARKLSIALNAGALPVPVSIIEQRNIGATLGEKAIKNSLIAGVLALVVVAFFMAANYGKKGLLADVALVIYALIVLAIFKIVPITLTLAGIAGFILSVGMAVDANILIFERIKEEIRWGRSPSSAMELGFVRAFPSIRDSNTSSLITCGILYWFGSGIIRGFALTLAIGIVVSLFSSITVTRTLLRMFNRE